MYFTSILPGYTQDCSGVPRFLMMDLVGLSPTLLLVWFGVTASSLRFTIIHIIYPLFFLGGGGVSCTVRHDHCGASHCSRRSCGVIDTSFRSSCSRFSVSWAQRSSLDSAFFPAFFFLLSEWTCVCSWGGGDDVSDMHGVTRPPWHSSHCSPSLS